MDTKSNINNTIKKLERTLHASIELSKELRECRVKFNQIIKLTEDIEKCLPITIG